MNDKYLEPLSQYEITAENVRKGRNGLICDTDQGIFLLKEYRGTLRRLEFETQVLSRIREEGLFEADEYVRTREGELFSVGGDGTRYVLKRWFLDRECNLRDGSEVRQAVGRIACLHRILREIEMEESWNLGSIMVEPVEEELERHNRELRRARNFMRSKRKKTEFELCVVDSFTPFYEQAVEAWRGMRALRQEYAPVPQYLCHGSLDQHHVLMASGGLAIIEFQRMHLGEQMRDLYHFMRKVMEKHNWDLELGMEMLKTYDRALPLSRYQTGCLYYLFLYPERYWKQINFYYNANKAWIPARNIEKMRSFSMQMDSRKRFLSSSFFADFAV